MAVSTVNVPMPIGNTYRGAFSEYINGAGISREDFMREAQLLNYQQNLNLETLERQNAFSAEMDNSKYQRAVSDLKKAGLNPILAYQGLANNAPTSGSGGSPSRSSYKGGHADTGALINSLMSLATTAVLLSAGLYGQSAYKATHFGFGAKIRK